LSYKIVHEDVVPPIELKPDVNPQFNAVIVKALAREPAQRFQSAEELCVALDAILPGGSNLRQKIVVESAKAASAALASVRKESRSKTVAISPPARKGRIWLWIAAVLLLLAGAGAAAAVLFPEWFNQTIQMAQVRLQPWIDRVKPAEPPPPELPKTEVPPAEIPQMSEEKPPAEEPSAAVQPETKAPEPAAASAAPVPPASSPSKTATELEKPAVEPSVDSRQFTPVSSGLIRISTVPPRAEIVFDDRSDPKWVTPYSFQNVSKGRHTLEVRKAGYVTERRIIVLLGNETQHINVVLTAAAGILNVSTDPPGAQIYVDGVLKKELTPANLKLPAGARRILLRKSGYRDVERMIEIEDNSYTDLNQPLAPLAP
jgi:serine/threonine protein kinase